MNKPLLLCSLLLFPILFSCSSHRSTVDSTDTVKTHGDAKDEKSCLEHGGEWTRAGLLGNFMCIYKASDAGKACSDGRQCEYKCIADYGQPVEPGKKTTGKCQATSSPFGCYSVIENGVAQPAVCVD